MLPGSGWRKELEAKQRRERIRKSDALSSWAFYAALVLALFMAAVEIGRRQERSRYIPVDGLQGTFTKPN